MIDDEVQDGDVFGWLLTQPQDRVLALLAFCTAVNTNTVEFTASRPNKAAEALGRAVKLDMRNWWRATADSYFGAVGKPVMVAAMQEMGCEDDPVTLLKLTKRDLAAKAAELAEAQEIQWLPMTLRVA